MVKTKFPKMFPTEALQALVTVNAEADKSKKTTLLTRAQWKDVTRHASYALGTLVTFFGNTLVPDLDQVKAPEGTVLEAVTTILADKASTASQSYDVLTPDEVVYCIALCQDTLTRFAKWADEPVAPAPDAQGVTPLPTK